ncbi:MAG: YggS family pyridoxal phosphate-dependent enzyme [Deltaproteobacteria bacterium]|nr:YggS family pyridoxal phosphate-dependent enzyme [Deltaproteobacteria bacterium]
MESMEIKDRLKQVKARIAGAAEAVGRDPDSITLVAVSKTVPAERVAAAIRAGVTDLGENYVQEAQEKIQGLADQAVSWHFIGHLQSNKAKHAVRLFDLIHSVDSLKLARALDKRAEVIGKVQKILIQVNISGEATKSGIAPNETLALARSIVQLENLHLCGLMTVPAFFNAPDRVRPHFKAMRELRETLTMKFPDLGLSELSMGMTGDFEAAIEEGATIVRIGTAIFGHRPR